MEKRFRVQGSKSEPYLVRFVFSGGQLSAFCDCSAGENGMACKHRLNILAGKDVGLVSGNSSEIFEVKNWLAGTELEGLMQKVEDLEAEERRVKMALKAAKKHLGRIMNR
jgi:hypothetical protein